MAKRRKSGRRVSVGRQRRIKIPQVRDRPLKLTKRDVLKTEEMGRESPYWFVLHRRGPQRPTVGVDPNEARAVPETQVRGTLPERVMLKFIIEKLHFGYGSDFTFQSSLQGGRLELGGVVADFVFPVMKIVIRVQGPTHGTYIRMRKDDEQREILESMGFTVWDIETETILNEYALEEWARRHFNLYHAGGGAAGVAAGQTVAEAEGIVPEYDWSTVLKLMRIGQEKVDWLLSNA